YAVHALWGTENQNEISRLYTDLITETTTGHLDEPRRLPLAIGVANQQDAAAMLNAEDERTADHPGEDRDALSIGKHRRRYLSLRHLHRLREDGGRIDDSYFRWILRRYVVLRLSRG